MYYVTCQSITRRDDVLAHMYYFNFEISKQTAFCVVVFIFIFLYAYMEYMDR